jgi:acyl carrier protein
MTGGYGGRLSRLSGSQEEHRMDGVKAKLHDFILSEFLPGEPPARLKGDTPLRTNGILDSLGTLKVIEFVEDHYRLSVEAHEADERNFGSIDSIAAFIERRSKGR